MQGMQGCKWLPSGRRWTLEVRRCQKVHASSQACLQVKPVLRCMWHLPSGLFMSNLFIQVPEFRRTLDASTGWQRGMNQVPGWLARWLEGIVPLWSLDLFRYFEVPR